MQTGTRQVVSTSRVLDRLNRGSAQITQPFKQAATGMDGAGRAAGNNGRESNKATGSLRKNATAVQQVNRSKKGFNLRNAAFSKGLALFGKLGGKLAGLVGKFSTVTGIASGVMQAVNLVMKGNPLALLATLLLPMAGQLIEFAMNSETGKQIMEEVFSAASSMISGAMAVIKPHIEFGLALVTGVFAGIKLFLEPAKKFLTGDISGGVKATGKAWEQLIHGLGEFIKTGFLMAVGILKAPVNGIIGFANKVIDALNTVHVSLLGKKFGFDLDRIPMLAQGGIVSPRDGGVPVILAEAGEAEAVLPMSKLGQLLARTRELAGAAATGRPRLAAYHEPEGRGSHGIAEELLFLAQTHSSRR
ncbi:hypothetical protein AC230_25725 [Streptomyces caatingaensis]|uniref:Tape-measure protein n=1 Tax=Streptomyces caatingaensis TaxID=1678637 RepID=A0A0K9XA71_9ACTN|nr:hypothetical protein AC230_25725 [Streptomyces caatingaensis]